MYKRLLNLILVFCMVFSIMPSAFATESTSPIGTSSVVNSGEDFPFYVEQAMAVAAADITGYGDGAIGSPLAQTGMKPMDGTNDMELFVGSAELTSITPYTVDGITATADPGENHRENSYALFDGDTGTLTLHNFSYIGSGYLSFAIYATGDLTMVLEEENSVIHDVSKGDYSYGIYCSGTLTISGSGNLVANGGEANIDSYGIFSDKGISVTEGTVTAMGSNADGFSYGIKSNGEIAINDGTVTATGGEANTGSYGIGSDNGISVTSGTVTAMGNNNGRFSYGIDSKGDISIIGGTVTAMGSNADGFSYGIKSNGEIAINDGTVTAQGGNVKGNSYGIHTFNFTSINGGIVTATGGVANTGSYGIGSDNGISVTNGTVTAMGNNNGRYSYGIDSKGDISIIGGTVTAMGGNVYEYSYGMNSSKDIFITGGTVTAESGTSNLSQAMNKVPAATGDIIRAGNSSENATDDTYSNQKWVNISFFKAELSDFIITGTMGTDIAPVNATITLTGAAFSPQVKVGTTFDTNVAGISAQVTQVKSTTEVDVTILGLCGNYGRGNIRVILQRGTVEGATDGVMTAINTSATYQIKLRQPIKRTTALNLSSSTQVNYRNIYDEPSFADAQATNITDTGEGWAWYLTAADGYEANTLVLSGTTISLDEGTKSLSALMLPAATTVVVAADTTNTVEIPTCTHSTFAIEGKGELKIQGSGTLHATAGASSNTFSYGIYADGDIQIGDSVIVTATSGDVRNTSSHETYSGAIDSYSGSVTIGGTATVTASAGNAIGSQSHMVFSFGLYGAQGVTIGDTATVTATSGDATGNGNAPVFSCGIYGESGVNIGGGTVTASCGTALNGLLCEVQPVATGYIAQNPDSVITIGSGLFISAPAGGKLSGDRKTIVNSAGSAVTTVTIEARPTSSGGSSYSYYTIKANAGANGSISPSGSASVREGLSKTYTFTPNDGYEIADVLVDGKSVGAVKDYTFKNVTKDHTITAIFKLTGDENPQIGVDDFTDVQEDDWFYESVKTAVENGWFSGTSDTTFSPALSTTRGMIATVLWRMENEPTGTAASIFDDVAAGSWYYSGIAWAQEQEIVGGYGNGKFGANDNMTREQMASILYRYAQKIKGLEIVTLEDNLNAFTDSNSMSEYAIFPMNWAVGNGLISGKGNGILDPKGYATRAEAAAILARFDGLFNAE